MDKDPDKGKKKEAMEPVMIEEDQINKIMERDGMTRSSIPYQYKMNNKNRVVAERDGLESYEEEV
jgi:hypothetical protein